MQGTAHTYNCISITLILGPVQGTAEKGPCLLHSHLHAAPDDGAGLYTMLYDMNAVACDAGVSVLHPTYSIAQY